MLRVKGAQEQSIKHTSDPLNLSLQDPAFPTYLPCNVAVDAHEAFCQTLRSSVLRGVLPNRMYQ